MAQDGNGILASWLKLVLAVVLIVAGGFAAFITVQGQANANCEQLRIIRPKVELHDRELGELRTKQELILMGVERIADKVDRIAEKVK